MVDDLQIYNAAQIIKSGGLVAFPTETVYGLGANALNPHAVAKIFAAKERPNFDPLIVHVADIKDINMLTKELDGRVLKIIEKFWPGPLTIVLPKSDAVPDIVSSGLPTVAIRMPNNAIALKLIEFAGCPIAAPSANKFGRISPTTAQHVKKQLPDIDCILDGGSTNIGIESTVISLNDDGYVILRQGFIGEKDLNTVLPKSKFPIKMENKISSPGLLNSHYSPLKPIYIIGEKMPEIDKSKAGFISFTAKNFQDYKYVEFLSMNQNLNEAAVNLFKALHHFEDSDVDYIVAESVPLTGIGIAIMDRLTKAAYKYKF